MSGAIGSTPGNYYRRNANLGYTSGAFHKRHANIGYSPGSHYQRFGSSGLIQSRNMTAMNRAAVDNVRAAYANSGPQVFEAKTEQSYGLSELAAEQVLKRAQDAMNALADQGEETSAANGGTGANVDETV